MDSKLGEMDKITEDIYESLKKHVCIFSDYKLYSPQTLKYIHWLCRIINIGGVLLAFPCLFFCVAQQV